MAKKNTQKYKKQKVSLLFDADFPISIAEKFCHVRKWKKNFKFIHVIALNRENKSDIEHFQYCKKKDYTLVTMDNDFFDNNKFPFQGSNGVIKISTIKDVEKNRKKASKISRFLTRNSSSQMVLGRM